MGYGVAAFGCFEVWGEARGLRPFEVTKKLKMEKCSILREKLQKCGVFHVKNIKKWKSGKKTLVLNKLIASCGAYLAAFCSQLRAQFLIIGVRLSLLAIQCAVNYRQKIITLC